MKFRFVTGCIAVAFASVCIGKVQAQRGINRARGRDAVDNGWHFDYQAARKLARRANKPLMVVFRCVP